MLKSVKIYGKKPWGLVMYTREGTAIKKPSPQKDDGQQLNYLK